MEVGTVVGGRFRLERRLGEGGMGVVWEAANLRTHRVVALKILKAETTAQRRRLLREGHIAGKLRHPNIVEVHDVIELDNGTPAIVMERLQGESLRALLNREKTIALPRIAEICIPLAEVLSWAHAQGVVHRDLKPDNIFLALDSVSKEQIKVLDFGIAREAEGDVTQTSPLTATGDVLGTPSYMAPEQVFGEKDIDTRADVWSFGVLLYECLTGKKPFVGDNFGQIFKQVAMGQITPIEEHLPDVPRDLASMIMKMLARNRAERPNDWSAVIAVLAHPSRSTASSERPQVVPEPPQSSSRQPRALQPSSKSFGWSSRIRRSLGGVAVATAVVATGLLARRHMTQGPTSEVRAVVAPAVETSTAPPTATSASAASANSVPPPASAPTPVWTRPHPIASASPNAAPSRAPDTDPVLPGGIHSKSPY